MNSTQNAMKYPVGVFESNGNLEWEIGKISVVIVRCHFSAFVTINLPHWKSQWKMITSRTSNIISNVWWNEVR